MLITPIPCLTDNYAYIIYDKNSKTTGVVDPSEAEPIIAFLKKEKLKLNYIFNTHHHFDHVGGNKELLSEHPELKIFGHASDKGRIPGQNIFLEKGDNVFFGKKKGIIYSQPRTYFGSRHLCFWQECFYL